MITTPSSYQGKYQIAQDTLTQNKVQKYIDLYEPIYLAKVFGATFSSEFTSVPSDSDLLFLFEPFQVDTECKQLLVSDGVINMLCGFIYYHYMVDAKNQANQLSGTAKTSSEVSQNTGIESQIYERYNASVRTAKAIQEYVRLHPEIAVYSTYNGQKILFNYSL